MENWTRCKIVTPENLILKLGTRNYIEDATYYTIFDVDRLNGGFCTSRWSLTLLWLFPVLYCPFFSLQHPAGIARPIYMLYGSNDVVPPKDGPFGVRTMSDIIWGKCAPKTPQKGAWIGVFKQSSQNTKTCILSKLLHRFQPNFAPCLLWVIQSPWQQIQDVGRLPSWIAKIRDISVKIENRDTSVTVWPIATKFGMICLRNLVHLKILSFWGQQHYQTGTGSWFATSAALSCRKLRWRRNYAADDPSF